MFNNNNISNDNFVDTNYDNNDNNMLSRAPHTRTCNCRVPDNCPVNYKCLTSDVVYTAVVHSGNDKNNQKIYKYVGATSTPFRNRFTNHISLIQ